MVYAFFSLNILFFKIKDYFSKIFPSQIASTTMMSPHSKIKTLRKKIEYSDKWNGNLWANKIYSVCSLLLVSHKTKS